VCKTAERRAASNLSSRMVTGGAAGSCEVLPGCAVPPGLGSVTLRSRSWPRCVWMLLHRAAGGVLAQHASTKLSSRL